MEMDDNRKNFVDSSSEFKENFEQEFVNYFVVLCLLYEKDYSKDKLEKVALLVYNDVFNADYFLTPNEEIFPQILNDGILIGSVITRSMFFLLENYVKESSNYVKFFVLNISEYIKQFEKQICEKSKIKPSYINFDTFDNISTGSNIMDVFQNIKESGEEITFFNLYEGVPISHGAVIVDIDGEDVSFKTIQTQEIAMKMDGQAYILQDENFDKYIKADIVYNNFTNNTVVLSNFTYLLNMPATAREFIRVHPDIMAEVTLTREQELATKGKLFDLSVNGLGVISEENNGIYAGAKITVNFVLDIETFDQPLSIQVDGEVLNIIEYSNSYRYCIRISPKLNVEKKIENYVNLRKVEILDALNKEVSKYK